MVFQILNFNIFLAFFFREVNIFGGMIELWTFVWGHHKTGLFWGHLYTLYDVQIAYTFLRL